MALKLNIGCDYDYKKGWVNLDNQGNPDVIYDLNLFPYPFKDNTFDLILASHVLEHLENPVKVMKELWRISKDKAVIIIDVPYFNHHKAYADLTHKKLFTWKSFDHLTEDEQADVGYIPKLFIYKEKKLIWGKTKKTIFKPVVRMMNLIINSHPELLEKRFPFLIPIETLHIEFSVKKEKSRKDLNNDLTEEEIYKSLKKNNKKYLMNSEEWKKLRKKQIGQNGKINN